MIDDSQYGNCVLLVEPDPTNAHTLTSYLSTLGYRTINVSTGVEAVIAARGNPLSIIFLATQLRDVMGTDLISWLRANPQLATTPIIALSALDEEVVLMRTKGADGVMRKPISFQSLVTVLRQHEIYSNYAARDPIANPIS